LRMALIHQTLQFCQKRLMMHLADMHSWCLMTNFINQKLLNF